MIPPLATGDSNGVRMWDADTAQSTGLIIKILPHGEFVITDAVSHEVINASIKCLALARLERHGRRAPHSPAR
jgi:hypothetical protein